MAGLVEARQGAVRRAGEQPAIAQERRCVVECLERAVRRQAAGVGAAFQKLGEARHALLYSARVATAAIVTIGNELLSGDVVNTNGSWLARRLERVGIAVRLLAVLPDDIEEVAAFLRLHAPAVEVVLVTGGLGGTPDDVTREALAATFGVPQVEYPEVAEQLRARFRREPDYVSPWALLPEGSRPLENPLGGAPGFAIGAPIPPSGRRAARWRWF